MVVVESFTARDEAGPGLCQAASHSSHSSGTWLWWSENSESGIVLCSGSGGRRRTRAGRIIPYFEILQESLEFVLL